MTQFFDNTRDNGDDRYQEWLEQHPGGFVLNTRRMPDPDYMVLHAAKCPTIRTAWRSTSDNPFTGEKYIKVCAESVSSLRAWIRSQGASDFTKRCQLCAPVATGESA